jgi:Zn-dependent peptidase ImmA (M78 family)
MTREIDRRIRKSRVVLQNQFAHLNGDGSYDAILADAPSTTQEIQATDVFGGRTGSRALSRKEIESVARKLQKLIWLRRSAIFGTEDVDPRKILNPTLALECLGYEVTVRESLGLHAAGKDSFEVAGIVEKQERRVQISRRFESHKRNFTAAHELGHALLHERSGLHRDRALDGSAIGVRDQQETEADIFATFFLLPERQVRPAFKSRFLADQFEPTDATAFALISGSLSQLQSKCRSTRELSRTLAGAQRFNGRHFVSLAEAFDVSVEAMAIRLEELELIRGK